MNQVLSDDQETEAVEGIHDALDEIRIAEKKLGRAISYAQWRGASWSAIGDALGVSKQAAWERWKDVRERAERGDFD